MMRVKKLITIILLLSSSVAFSQPKLIFALDLVRHGDRTPTGIIPSRPYRWTLGLGALTPLGMHQEYENGKRLRQLYIYRYHLLPTHYQSQVLYAQSDDSNRTLMSAQAVLLGLYPPGTGPLLVSGKPALPHQIQPIPIHTISGKRDRIFLAKDYYKKKYLWLLQHKVYKQVQWRMMQHKWGKQLKRWSDILGVKNLSLQNISHYGGIIAIQKLKHIALPKKLTKQDIKNIIYLTNWTWIFRYHPKPVGTLIANHMLEKILSYMRSAKKGQTTVKYVLFSGHDTNIAGVMSALGIPLQYKPPYAADIRFMLVRDHHCYSVMIFYQDKLVRLPGCGAACDLNSLSKLINAF